MGIRNNPTYPQLTIQFCNSQFSYPSKVILCNFLECALWMYFGDEFLWLTWTHTQHNAVWAGVIDDLGGGTSSLSLEWFRRSRQLSVLWHLPYYFVLLGISVCQCTCFWLFFSILSFYIEKRQTKRKGKASRHRSTLCGAPPVLWSCRFGAGVQTQVL